MRYFIQFAYFGKAYHGWQIQPNAITVQEVLEEGLSKLLRSTITVTGAGRTDAGVHAREMFAHFDFDVLPDTLELANRLNNYLPSDIAIKSVFKVGDESHARFDAVERTYEYWIAKEKNPFLLETAHYIWRPLDINAMNEAANVLLDYRDFECFSKSNTDVKTFLCDIKEAVWTKKEDVLVFTITADRFLRNMVRAIVGTLLEVGSGKASPRSIKEIIESKNRARAGVSVPANGLYLTKVLYPQTIVNE